MTLRISLREFLRPSFFSVALVFALLLTLPSFSSRALAQQPDNDDMNRPSAEKPDKIATKTGLKKIKEIKIKTATGTETATVTSTDSAMKRRANRRPSAPITT